MFVNERMLAGFGKERGCRDYAKVDGGYKGAYRGGGSRYHGGRGHYGGRYYGYGGHVGQGHLRRGYGYRWG